MGVLILLYCKTIKGTLNTCVTNYCQKVIKTYLKNITVPDHLVSHFDIMFIKTAESVYDNMKVYRKIPK